MLQITRKLSLPLEEIGLTAVRAQGAGGQNVNKVATAIHLRFDIRGSSLPEEIKTRLLRLGDQRISGSGVVVIKAQRHRSQWQNRLDALERLRELISRATQVVRPRKATRPTRGSQKKRLDKKTRRSRVKSLRGRVRE